MRLYSERDGKERKISEGKGQRVRELISGLLKKAKTSNVIHELTPVCRAH